MDESKRYVSLGEILQTVPPGERPRIVAELGAIVAERESARRWVTEQVESKRVLPDTVYKYIPRRLLGKGPPWTLRATQPVALNDVMEGNVMTVKEDRHMDRDAWYEMLGLRLRELFGEDAPTEDELDLRKRLYGDPRVSTVIRKHLSRFVGVVSFSANSLNPTMWAHYAESSGFVVGYRTEALRPLGIDLRGVLYMELAPNYQPMRRDVVEVNFVDEEARRRNPERGTTPIMESYDFTTLTTDWRTSSSLLFVKSEAWRQEEEVRLLVDQATASATGECDGDGHPIRVIEVPDDAVTEVFVGLNTPEPSIQAMVDAVNSRYGGDSWHLTRMDWHAYSMVAGGRAPQRPNRAPRSMADGSG